MTKPFSSVWTREPRRTKTVGLSREQIVRAAVALLDADGLDALSMRRLGTRLDAGATSLYWHVANKDELLELALDEMWGRVTVPDPDRVHWREVATTYAYSLRAAMIAHPWAGSLVGRLPSVGPCVMQISDRLRRAFVHAGFTGDDVYLATGAVTSYVLGQVIPEVTWNKAHGSDEFDVAGMRGVVDQVAADYPEMAADFRKTLARDPAVSRAVAFDFGLLAVMDGLEHRLNPR